MNFSDWTVVISILFGVLLAVFRFDEWEVITLKRVQRFALLPIWFLLLCGISSYFNSNNPPIFLNFFWIEKGLPAGVWAIIWLSLSGASLLFCWRRFTHQHPSPDLIRKYIDYLETLESAKFSSLFRKYERNFFSLKDEHTWEPYEQIMCSEKWWLVSPREVFRAPHRFYDLSEDVLLSLLNFQLSRLPSSQLAKDIEMQWNGVTLTDETPILNTYLSHADFIERNWERNILVPTIKDWAEEYFSSLTFHHDQKPLLSLKPSDNAYRQVAPHALTVFYFIQIIDCYWKQVFVTGAKVSGFYLYHTWSQNILDEAPSIDIEYTSDTLPNLYLHAIHQILSNIRDWISFVESKRLTQFGWAITHFAELKRWILFDLQEKYSDKISKQWLIEEIKHSLQELIWIRSLLGESFDPNFSDHSLTSDLTAKAFKQLTNDRYFLESEKQDLHYQWLKNFLNLP